MNPLDWKDASENDASSKQNASSFGGSLATPWFGVAMLLVGLIIGFAIGNGFTL